MDDAVANTAAPVAAPAAPAASGGAPAATGGAPAKDAAPKVDAAPAASVASSGAPAASSFPDHKSFKWDKWEGKFDELPEPVRGWGEKVWSVADRARAAELESARKDAKFYEEAFNAFRPGDDDPAVAEWRAKHDAMDQQYKTLAAEHEALKQQAAQAEEKQATALVNDFKSKHPEYWSNPEKGTALAGLLDKGFFYMHAHSLLELGPEAVPLAQSLLERGLPQDHIVEYVSTKLKAATPPAPKPQVQPRPAASLVRSGAHADTADAKPNKQASFAERRLAAIDSGIKKAR